MCDHCRELENEMRRLKRERDSARLACRLARREYREIDDAAGSAIAHLRNTVAKQAAEIDRLTKN